MSEGFRALREHVLAIGDLLAEMADRLEENNQ